MAEESPVTRISSESSDASIIETSDNDDTSKYSEDADSNKLKTTETVDSDNSDKITDENFDTKVEVDDEIEGEVEAETKSNDEFLENQNASIDSGLDYGETPLVDFAHEEEDEIDTEKFQGENMTTASITSTAIQGEIVEAGDALQEEAVNGDDANIDDTYASPTKIEVDADSDVEAEGKVEAEAVTGVKAEAEVETDADAEVEGETEAEAGGETDAEIKIDVEASEIYDAIENQNASSDSGLDSGETRPLVDPEHEENIADKEDEADTDQDQGENITTASITSIATVGDMLEEDDDSQEKAVNGDEVSVNDAGSLLSTIEVDAETEVEIDTKTDEEVSKENNAIENQNASSDSGVEQGRTGPQVDPVGEEKVARKEDDTNTDNDQGEKSTTTSITSTAIVGEMFNEVDALQEKTVLGDEVGIYDADSSLTASATITPTKNKYKANGEELVVEEEKKLDKFNFEDHSHAKDYTHDDIEQEKLQSNLKSSKKENAKDQQLQLPPSSTSTETMDMLSSCHPTLRNAKGLECTFQSTVSSHPAGSLAASLTIFFFCYCACRMRGGGGSKRWRKRIRDFRRRKGDNGDQGDYAALAVYDELLESFDDEELSSLYRSRDGDDGSDSSMSTILSEWSGKDNDIEMASLEDGYDDYNKDK